MQRETNKQPELPLRDSQKYQVTIDYPYEQFETTTDHPGRLYMYLIKKYPTTNFIIESICP